VLQLGTSPEPHVPVRLPGSTPGVSILGFEDQTTTLGRPNGTQAPISPRTRMEEHFSRKKAYQPSEVRPCSPEQNKPISIFNRSVVGEVTTVRYGQRRTWDGEEVEPEQSEMQQIADARRELLSRNPANIEKMPVRNKRNQELTRKIHWTVHKAVLPAHIEEEGMRRFRELDVEKTGRISYQQFLQVVQKADHPSLQVLFDKFDADKSGRIARDEYLNILEILKWDPLTER